MDRRRLSDWFSRLTRSSVEMVWPRLCEVCGCRLTASEQVMCLGCELAMPFTGLHLTPEWNEIHERLAPHPPIDRAASLFYYFRDDDYRMLIHNAKYNGRPGILRYLGRRYGATLRQSGFMDGIDLIEPVPMHWWKRLRRGYNQTESLAQGLSQSTGLEIGDHLTVSRIHSTQTHKSQYQRWINARSAYGIVDGDELAGRHVLLVDDVITTGATIITCARLLAEAAPGVKVSVVSIGLTRLN